MKIGGEPLREIGALLGDEVRVWRWKRALAIAERAHGSSTKAHQPARGAEMMRQFEEVGQNGNVQAHGWNSCPPRIVGREGIREHLQGIVPLEALSPNLNTNRE